MTGLVLALGVAVAQFWPAYGLILIVLGIFLVGEGNVLAPKLVGESVGILVRLSVRLRRFAGRRSACGHNRHAHSLCATPYLQSSLYTGEKAD